MQKQEIYDFINCNQVAHLATTDGDQPRVRGMMLYSADESGIVFHTGPSKELYSQLLANPQVELCLNDWENQRQIRIMGRVELDEDLELKKKIVSERDFLQPWIEEHGYGLLAVFRVREARSCIWTMQTNFAPKEYIEL